LVPRTLVSLFKRWFYPFCSVQFSYPIASHTRVRRHYNFCIETFRSIKTCCCNIWLNHLTFRDSCLNNGQWSIETATAGVYSVVPERSNCLVPQNDVIVDRG